MKFNSSGLIRTFLFAISYTKEIRANNMRHKRIQSSTDRHDKLSPQIYFNVDAMVKYARK